MSTATAAVIAGLFGLIIGSFLNVVAYRLPRKESLVKPRSRCPSCGNPVRPYDNIPVLSWLILRGKCRDCGAPISIRYPIVEATTGILYGAVVAARDDAGGIALGLILVTALVPIVLIDLEYRLIPNAVSVGNFSVLQGIVIKYAAAKHRCLDCGGYFLPKKYKQLRQFGHALKCWTLYHHVANKEQILDGMVDRVFAEIDLPEGGDWKSALRRSLLSLPAL